MVRIVLFKASGVDRKPAYSLMERIMKRILAVPSLALVIFCWSVQAQDQAPAQQPNSSIYHITMVAKTVTAINYQHRSGSTMIDFRGTPLLPLAKGQAKIDSKKGSITIDSKFSNLQPATTFGAEYLTYVLWAITPEGKPTNLGEVMLDGTNSKLYVTTLLQSFGLIVTAEPYFAVNMPSDVVVLENIARADTKGTTQDVTANYELLRRGQYTYTTSNVTQPVSNINPKVPLEVYQARNAIQIAVQAGADKYASSSLEKAESSLNQAEGLVKSKGDKKLIIAAARDAVQTAADARQISLKRAAAEAAANQEAENQRAAAAAAAATAAAEAKQKQEEAARQQAEMQKLKAERDAAEQSAEAARADAAKQAAQQAEKEAQAAAAKAELEKQQLRAALLDQFNRVLPTTDTPRGLKVNMADVLFATAKYDLQPSAREALAKLSGIILAHPGLRLAIEGFTDSTGTEAFNQTLSEQRANAVRDYLVQQSLDPASVTATGFGESNPAASNDTAAGRQLNRRVEIIISGEVIGTKIGSTPSTD
jgi:outer membrane protein OmpA-like peptidoglycan-associated protein